MLLDYKKSSAKSLLRNLLSQHLSKGLVLELQNLYWPNHADKPMAEIPDAVLMEVAGQLQDWQLKPSGTEGYRTAEVTLCGVDTDHLSSKTMECKTQPGLYFVGEVMDVTGHLGGYNFQWAWASGHAAGQYV
jgi:predicted flavoprotein YhiN